MISHHFLAEEFKLFHPLSEVSVDFHWQLGPALDPSGLWGGLCAALGGRGQWDRVVGAQRCPVWCLWPRAAWHSCVGQPLAPRGQAGCLLGCTRPHPLGFAGHVGFPSHHVCHSSRLPAGPHPSHQTPRLLHRLLHAGKSSALLASFQALNRGSGLTVGAVLPWSLHSPHKSLLCAEPAAA